MQLFLLQSCLGLVLRLLGIPVQLVDLRLQLLFDQRNRTTMLTRHLLHTLGVLMLQAAHLSVKVTLSLLHLLL